MDGRVVRLVKTRGFGFIRALDNKEYFFHMDNLHGVRFEEIIGDFDRGREIIVQFDPASSPKGEHAINIQRLS